MATLALTEAGVWVDEALTGEIGQWGDSLVTWRRVTSTNITRFTDTGVGASFTGFDINGTSGTDLYTYPGQSPDAYLYLGNNNDLSLTRIDTSGGRTNIATKSAGAWKMSHAGHPSYVITSHRVGSSARITRWDKPGGGTGIDLVVAASSDHFDVIEVDSSTGDVFAATYDHGNYRGVDRYEDDGTLLWEAFIPNASDGSTSPVYGIAYIDPHLVVYTSDNDQPGGTRVNNNWWLIDPATGDVELLDTTIDGTAYASWVGGTNSLMDRTGSLSSGIPSGHVAIGGSLGRVFTGTIDDGANPWSVGRIRWS